MESKQISMQGNKLTDSFGRIHDYLRLSITDRCNLRCTYCMPSNPVFLPHSNVLNLLEIDSLVDSFIALGVNKVRLTGGEPMVRPDFDAIAATLAKKPVSLHLTTNGYFIDEHIAAISECFDSVNVSLDTLKKERFKTITQRNAFDRTLKNIDLLLSKNIPTKVNVVLVRNINDDEIYDFVELTRRLPLEVRFIEFMPFNGNRWNLAQAVPQAEIIRRIEEKYAIEMFDRKVHQTAQKLRVKGSKGVFGLISTVSQPFCADCNRIRITADGKIKNCLFSQHETDIRHLIDDPARLAKAMAEEIQKKHYSYGGKAPMTNSDSQQQYTLNRTMTAIGG